MVWNEMAVAQYLWALRLPGVSPGTAGSGVGGSTDNAPLRFLKLSVGKCLAGRSSCRKSYGPEMSTSFSGESEFRLKRFRKSGPLLLKFFLLLILRLCCKNVSIKIFRLPGDCQPLRFRDSICWTCIRVASKTCWTPPTASGSRPLKMNHQMSTYQQWRICRTPIKNFLEMQIQSSELF